MKQIRQSSVKTPVLLIIFNRPELTRRVIRALSAFQPETVLVAADGPRFAAEQARCQETRECISGMDWACQVQTNFSDVNSWLRYPGPYRRQLGSGTVPGCDSARG
jgi:hypothetical protein